TSSRHARNKTNHWGFTQLRRLALPWPSRGAPRGALRGFEQPTGGAGTIWRQPRKPIVTIHQPCEARRWPIHRSISFTNDCSRGSLIVIIRRCSPPADLSSERFCGLLERLPILV